MPTPLRRRLWAGLAALLTVPALAAAPAHAATAGAAARWSARDLGLQAGAGGWLAPTGDAATTAGIITAAGAFVAAPQGSKIVGIRDDGAAFWYRQQGDVEDPGKPTFVPWEYGWLLPNGGIQNTNLGFLTVPDVTYGYHALPEKVTGNGTVAGTVVVNTFGFALLAGWHVTPGGGAYIVGHRYQDVPTKVEQFADEHLVGIDDTGQVTLHEIANYDDATRVSRFLVDESESPRCQILAVSDNGRYLVGGPPCTTSAPGDTIPLSLTSDPLHAIDPAIGPPKDDVTVENGYGVSWLAVNRRDQVLGTRDVTVVVNGANVDRHEVRLWDPGQGTITLNTVLGANGATAPDLRRALDIDDKGRVLASGLGADGKTHLYLISASVTMTGVMVDPSGAPRSNIDVSASPGSGNESRAVTVAADGTLTTKTDKQGRFSFDLTPGTYTLTSSVPGCFGPAKPCQTKLTVEAGLTDPAPVKGTVDGAQPAGLTLKANAGLHPLRGALTVPLRCLQATAPCVGTITVTRRNGGAALASAKVRLKAGAKASIKVPLTKAGKTAVAGAASLPARVVVKLGKKTVRTNVVLKR